MWYNSTNLKPGRETLQKETARFFYLPTYMKPVQQHPLEDSGNKDNATPIVATSDCFLRLHSFSEPDAFIDFALDSILAFVEASGGSFFAWDEYAKELVLRAARGSARERLKEATIKLHEGVAGKVAEKGLPVLVQDIRTDVRFFQIEKKYQYSSYSFLSLPLIANNRLLGLINITEKENTQSFDQDDLERAQAFAVHVAVAYENVRIKIRFRDENQELRNTITGLKETMREEESLVALGKLASHIAHELANPLDAIRRFVNLALDQVEPEGLAREYLLKVKQGIRRSVQVIRGLRELSSVTAKSRKAKQMELHSVIDQALSSVQQDSSFENVSIQKQFSNHPIFVEDFGLQTVFSNLLQNAHHAMNGFGTVVIATKAQSDRAVVTIRDSGHGVPEGIKPRIFEPFFTTKDNGQGTGIGLTICKEIVQKCGGHICFESVENEGTEFLITLPCEI